jgi:Uma2 family endonuclease
MAVAEAAQETKKQKTISGGSCVEVEERVTAAEFLRIAPEERKAELIDGVIESVMPPLDIHENLQGFLLTLLRMYVEDRRAGVIRGSRTPAILSEYDAPEPDILFVSTERSEIIQRDGVHGAPDFVIEILSAGTAQNDRGPKFLAYEKAGVRELWLIDPYGPAGTSFHRLERGSFRPVQPNAGSVLKSAAVPGFWINVKWLWPGEEKFIPVRKALDELLSE